MATITFSLDIPETKSYNLIDFQQKLKAYARMLVEMPVLSKVVENRKKNESVSKATNASFTREEAERYIHSLSLKGGKDVPAHINGRRDLLNTKYM